MNITCNNCEDVIKKYLCDLPVEWANQIAKVICSFINPPIPFNCDDVKTCETLTKLSTFTVNGSEICIDYTDEDGTLFHRCFDIADIGFDLDPKCIMSQEAWDLLNWEQQVQAIIDYSCTCGFTTTTTTTSTTTTTTIAPTTTTTTSTTTTSTTTTSTTTTTTAPLGNFFYISTTGSDITGDGSIGNPWASLSKATTEVTTPNDTIVVTDGTYTENTMSSLAEGVNISGSHRDNVIINGNMTGDWSNLLLLDSAVNTNVPQTISGITFDGKYASEVDFKTWIGIWISGRSSIVIHDCKIVNFYDRGVVYDGNKQTNPLDDPGNHAIGNEFYNNILENTARNTVGYGAGQLNIGGQDGMLIHDNIMIQDQRVAGKNGWPIKYWENGFLKDCKIYNNTLTKAAFTGDNGQGDGDWDFAIELFNISGLEIYGNTIQGSIDLNYNYEGAYAYSAWIHDNILDNNPANQRMQSGIIFEFATETAIVENNTFSNMSHAILFNARTPLNSGGYTYPPPTGGYSALTNNEIRNNLFYNIYTTATGGFCCGGVGIQVYIEFDDNDPYIRKLNIYNNTFVAKSTSKPEYAIDFASFTDAGADVDEINVRNNIFIDFNGPYLIGSNPTNASNVVLTHNDAFGNGNADLPSWPGGNPTGYTYSNNLAVDPSFVGGGDYHLNVGSLCIDAGVNIGLPFNGTAPDMGYAETV